MRPLRVESFFIEHEYRVFVTIKTNFSEGHEYGHLKVGRLGKTPNWPGSFGLSVQSRIHIVLEGLDSYSPDTFYIIYLSRLRITHTYAHTYIYTHMHTYGTAVFLADILIRILILARESF